MGKLKREIKLEITLTNKWLYSLIALSVFLLLCFGVYAYNLDMRAGDPPVMGHSAGEIKVIDYNGDTVSLQAALDYLQPYEVIAPKSTMGDTVIIPESVIIKYCGDADGCELREVMHDWDSSFRSASRQNLFYYTPSTKAWIDSYEASAFGTMGVNNNGDNNPEFPEYVDAWWGCRLFDGKYENHVYLGDHDTDFGLVNWGSFGSASYSNAGCKLFIYD